MEKVRVGIIGCGGIANGKHLPSLSVLDDVEIVALCDILPEKAEEAAAKYGVPGAKVYTEYRKLLEDKTIDVVHVCTPNKSHAQISIDALDSGKHVMCEKPMAKTAADAVRMVEAAKRTGKKLTIGYQHRHKKQSLFLKPCIENGDLGEIYFTKALAVRRRGLPNWGVFLNADEQGGGPLIDIGTHSLDLALYMMDNYRPRMVVGTVYKKLNNPNCGNPWGPWDADANTLEDSAFGFIVMENGATISLESSWLLNTIEPIPEGSILLCGTKAGAQIKSDSISLNKDEYGQLVDIHPQMGAGGVNYFEGASSTPGEIEARRWIDAVKNDTDPVVLPEQACVVSQILEAIYTSSKTGEPYYFNR